MSFSREFSFFSQKFLSFLSLSHEKKAGHRFDKIHCKTQSLIGMKAVTMKSPILSKFLCCFDLRVGGYLMGFVDCVIYSSIFLVFSLQLFFDIEFIDKKHGEWLT